MAGMSNDEKNLSAPIEENPESPAASDEATGQKTTPLRELVQPFVDLVYAPRALWGINFPYFLEGMVYFGILQYLAMYFNDYVGLDDIWAGRMVGMLTAGITISMFLFGGLVDKWGVRIAIIGAFIAMLGGRALLSAAPYLGLSEKGLFAPINGVALGGILFIVLGYGTYMPAAYAGVKQFTSEKTAGMAYAMLYALMNLGGWLPTFFTPIRESFGIAGALWTLSAFTIISLISTMLLLSKKTVEKAIEAAKVEREREQQVKATKNATPSSSDKKETVPSSSTADLHGLQRVWHWLANHPLADAKFAFFIFCLIPVQTLFAHNWLTLPMYVERAYRESWPWISINFEKAVNANPLLIFILTPTVAAMTQKKKVYTMMILGTLVMGAPTFLLALGATPLTLVGFLFLMTVGEAMWQPRFLQYAAEIAPEGRTGIYMGVAQFPWFLTKMIVPLYSGWFLQHYCPKQGPIHTERMWFIYGLLAISSTVMLVLAKGWLGKDFKTKA
jgi:proton-dependent oligopeptide transporter, POT family